MLDIAYRRIDIIILLCLVNAFAVRPDKERTATYSSKSAAYYRTSPRTKPSAEPRTDSSAPKNAANV